MKPRPIGMIHAAGVVGGIVELVYGVDLYDYEIAVVVGDMVMDLPLIDDKYVVDDPDAEHYELIQVLHLIVQDLLMIVMLSHV